ncbi:MAG: TfoX/Sxy family transcriptional regulator of competence genes [Bacteriovoracaceae bacterium]|jgi:TfoX/Sxy family transcriptional regulator of competence genes
MSELQEFVKKRTASYPGISSRKLYGLEAFYLKNSPFIVITKDDQIVVKVDDFEVKAQLLNMPEVTKWSLDGKDMENWLLLPTSFNKKKNKLSPILEMTSKVLLNPRKQKKKRRSKPKTPKSVALKIETSQEKPSSFLKRLFSR